VRAQVFAAFAQSFAAPEKSIFDPNHSVFQSKPPFSAANLGVFPKMIHFVCHSERSEESTISMANGQMDSSLRSE
jgi:hypothetical protein